MKFIELRKLCNARFYSLEVYGADGLRKNVEIDVEALSYGGAATLSRCEPAEVMRFQPYVTDDGKPGLEVEVNF